MNLGSALRSFCMMRVVISSLGKFLDLEGPNDESCSSGCPFSWRDKCVASHHLPCQFTRYPADGDLRQAGVPLSAIGVPTASLVRTKVEKRSRSLVSPYLARTPMHLSVQPFIDPAPAEYTVNFCVHSTDCNKTFLSRDAGLDGSS